MLSTNTDQTILFETGGFGYVYAVAFHPDGKHVLGGDDDGIRRWRLADGQEVRKQIGMSVRAISVSRDQRWIVCGTTNGASVWDGELHEKVIEVGGTRYVDAVDVSPDSTRFATGSRAHEANIWSVTSGEQLVGPLKHDGDVDGIRFSPSGDRIATACNTRLRIFDSHGGDELVTIKIGLPIRFIGITPLVWSSNGQQIFAVSRDKKIRVFDTSTGTQLAESQIVDGDNDVRSIALAANGKFLATFIDQSISFLDTLTLTRIGPVVEDSRRISSIAISNSSHLATGRVDGNIVIRDLSKILPDSCDPFHTSANVEVRQDEQSPRSGGHDDQPPDPTLENPGRHSEDDSDLLELEARPSTPAGFDFDESLSLASSAPEDEIPPVGSSHVIPPVGSSHVIPQSSDTPPVSSIPEARAQEDLDTVVSPRSRSVFKRWLQRKSNKGPASHKPDRSGKSREPADCRSPPHSAPRVDDKQEGPVRMAASRPKTRSAARGGRRKAKSAAEAAVPKDPNEDTSRSGQGSAGANEASPAQQMNDSSQPSAAGVHLTEASGFATLSLTFPAWLLCFRSGTHDEEHLSS